MSPHGLLTHLYQSQFAMWRVLTQSCAKSGVPSVTCLCVSAFKTKQEWITTIFLLIKEESL